MAVTLKLTIFRCLVPGVCGGDPQTDYIPLSCLVPGVCGGDPPMKTDSHQLKVADYVHEQNVHGGELFILLSHTLDHFDPHCVFFFFDDWFVQL